MDPPPADAEPADADDPSDEAPQGDPTAPAPTTLLAGDFDDFAATASGDVFVVARADGGTLTGRCFAPDGSLRRTDFAIAAYPPSSLEGPAEVVTARDAGQSLVTWLLQSTPGDYGTRLFVSRLYDADCLPLTDAFAWPPPPSGNYIHDTAIDPQGSFALLWNQVPGAPDELAAYLSFYDNTGTKLGADVQVDATGACGIGGYAMHVALSAAGGVVTCQKHVSDPITYRRFGADRQLIDPGLIAIPETAGGRSAWYETHIVGVDDAGRFAVEWVRYEAGAYQASFFAANGALVRTTTLGSGATGDDFRARHQSVQLFGGSFIFRDNQAPTTFWLYSPVGELLGCDRTTDDKQRLRTGGATTTFIARAGDTIVRGALDFSGFDGCTPPGLRAMPDSATIFCSDGVDAGTPCPAAGEPGYGQDGSYQRHVPSYAANADTVTDGVSGLTWQRVAPAAPLGFAEAQSYCAELALGDETDWRLPSRLELISLIDYGSFFPALDPAAFASEPATYFWTATAVAYPLGMAWVSYSGVGSFNAFLTTGSDYVRCVRGPALASRFSFDALTATDETTGLVWQRQAAAGVYEWRDALAACEALDLAGAADWRVPTVKELLTLAAEDRYDPSVDPMVFPDAVSDYYWSSTPYQVTPAARAWIWIVELAFGGTEVALGVTSTARVRCVR